MDSGALWYLRISYCYVYLSTQMQLLEPWFQSADPFQRSAALIAMAVITEGCSEYIRNKSVHVLPLTVEYRLTYGGKELQNFILPKVKISNWTSIVLFLSYITWVSGRHEAVKIILFCICTCTCTCTYKHEPGADSHPPFPRGEETVARV